VGTVIFLFGVALIIGRTVVEAPLPFVIGVLMIGLFYLYRGIRWRALPDDDLIDQAISLHDEDPAAAEQLLDSVFTRRGEAETRELEELRERSRTDAASAEMLRTKLLDKLRVRDKARRFFEKHMANEPHLQDVLRSIEDGNTELRTILMELEETPRLSEQ